MAKRLYLTEVKFYDLVGVSYRYGAKLLKLGVISADACLNDESRPLFDPGKIELHRLAIRAYQGRQVAVAHNLKDLSHV